MYEHGCLSQSFSPVYYGLVGHLKKEEFMHFFTEEVIVTMQRVEGIHLIVHLVYLALSVWNPRDLAHDIPLYSNQNRFKERRSISIKIIHMYVQGCFVLEGTIELQLLLVYSLLKFSVEQGGDTSQGME